LWPIYKLGLWLFRHARISNLVEDELEATPCHDPYVRLDICMLIYRAYMCVFFVLNIFMYFFVNDGWAAE
jgi:hypothetical protein